VKRTKKRKVKDVPIYPRDPDFIRKQVEEINRVEWPYKRADVRDLLVARDKALVSLLVLIGVRISEALGLQRKWFTVEPDRISIGDIHTEKHGNVREGLWLPKTGRLAPITALFEAWLNQVPQDPEAYVFPTAKPFGNINWHAPMERGRAHWIIKTTINKFPHWFRGVTETYYGKVVFRNDPFKLKDFMGVRRIQSVYPYIGEPWRQDLENFSQE
jgi:integrase